MAELNLGPPPTRNPLSAILSAASILIVAAAATFLLNPRKTADLAVTGVKVYDARVVTKGTANTSSGNGTTIVGSTGSVDQDLYVLVRLKLTDDLRLPLFIKDETLVLTAPDGSILTANPLPPDQAASTLQSFPALAALASSPLPRDAQVAPGASAEGMVLFHFNGLTEANWTARKVATLTVDLFHQGPQTVTVP